MSRWFRKRNVYIYIGSLVVLALYVLTDPFFGIIQNLPLGAGTIATVLIILKGLLYVSLLHLTRKFIFDYDEADFSQLNKNAMTTPEGSGLAMIAYGLMVIAFSIAFFAAAYG